MARKVLVTQTCDYEHPEGEAAAEEESRRFSVDGRSYEIDLCGPHGEEFDRQLAEWADRARPAEPARPEPSARRAPRGKPGPSAATKEYNSRVREWAGNQGIYVADRGRIPGDVTARYDKAMQAP